jgi:uncharacterized protein YihD (DUF1040 family)
MRDKNRIAPLLKRLQDLWEKFPDLRLGQMITSLASKSDNIYFMEDEEIITSLEKKLSTVKVYPE